MIEIPSDAKLWEAVAIQQIAQNIPAPPHYNGKDKDIHELIRLFSDVYMKYRNDGITTSTSIHVNLDRAFRLLQDSKQTYHAVVHKAMDKELPLPKSLVLKSSIQPKTENGILLTPFSEVLLDGLGFPQKILKEVVRHLTTYDLPLFQLGKNRLDYCSFTEEEILNGRSFEERVQAIADAKVIVGFPNSWTWLATTWDKNMVLFVPDTVPPERWFPFHSRNFVFVQYTPSQLTEPVVVTGLRQALKRII